jgi:hypothetical protein
MNAFLRCAKAVPFMTAGLLMFGSVAQASVTTLADGPAPVLPVRAGGAFTPGPIGDGDIGSTGWD